MAPYSFPPLSSYKNFTKLPIDMSPPDRSKKSNNDVEVLKDDFDKFTFVEGNTTFSGMGTFVEGNTTFGDLDDDELDEDEESL